MHWAWEGRARVVSSLYHTCMFTNLTTGGDDSNCIFQPAITRIHVPNASFRLKCPQLKLYQKECLSIQMFIQNQGAAMVLLPWCCCHGIAVVVVLPSCRCRGVIAEGFYLL